MVRGTQQRSLWILHKKFRSLNWNTSDISGLSPLIEWKGKMFHSCCCRELTIGVHICYNIIYHIIYETSISQKKYINIYKPVRSVVLNTRLSGLFCTCWRILEPSCCYGGWLRGFGLGCLRVRKIQNTFFFSVWNFWGTMLAHLGAILGIGWPVLGLWWLILGRVRAMLAYLRTILLLWICPSTQTFELDCERMHGFSL